MELDLNEIAQTFKPWDFVIVIDGRKYRTKPFRLADAELLAQLSKMSGSAQQIFMAGLFEDPAPDVSAWDEEQASYVIAALQAARREMIRKNGQMIVETIFPTPRSDNRRASA